jgi:uncharacterized protein YqgC (DUF456 family)
MHWLADVGVWIWYVIWAGVLLCTSLLVYVGLSGNFVLVALALIYALVTGFHSIGWHLLILLLGIAVVGEILEYLIGIFYVHKKGASKKGVVGAFVGGLAGAALGAPLFPIAGAVLGSFVGAFLGAILGEYWHQRRLEPSLRIGGHAFLGKLAAMFVKHALGLVIVGLVLRATWPG